MKYHCNKCQKEMFIYQMNDIEFKELRDFGEFTCFNCVNDEMIAMFKNNEDLGKEGKNERE